MEPDERVFLWGPKGEPLRWWRPYRPYKRRLMGFASPQERQAWDEYMAWKPDERPLAPLEDEAEGIWLEGQEEEGEEDE